MELLVLSLFCGALLLCILFGQSIVYALVAGLFLFLFYAGKKGFGWREQLEMSLSGIKTVKNILITFVLIGMLTALWRDAGTIPLIVCYATRMIQPSLFLVMAFLLNCMVSVLTGTAFGTAATMGVICTTVAATMGVDLALTGGAVLSGIYFGDRCSPVSTSALLVSELTHTSIYQNIRWMCHSAVIPFLSACALYTVAGLWTAHAGTVPDLQSLFRTEFALHWVAILPAVGILILSVCQVKVKIAMGVSILIALPISILLQGTTLGELPSLLFYGYHSTNPQLSGLVNGGGIFSMVKVGAIVCLSSCYAGIFQKTGLLEHAEQAVSALSQKTTPYAATLLTAIATSMLACNQTLSIMLTHQLCHRAEPNNERLALYLEDSAVIIAPLIPWSIASAVPQATLGVPAASMALAFFLYLLPVWRVIVAASAKHKTHKKVAQPV